MPDCPECHRLKCRVDIAAALSAETATYFLRLNGDAAESSAAIQEMRRARQQLEEFEIRYEEHIARHANTGRMSIAS
jgi:hypothetical protein